MEDYFEKINDFICLDNYDIFFENPREEYGGPDFERNAQISFGFAYLKLIDLALSYSKENILKEYDENKNSPNLNDILFKSAVYPSGEALGFYNTSKHDLKQLSNIIANGEMCDELLSYIDGFSDNVKEVFVEIEFEKHLNFLVKYDLLSILVSKVYSTPLSKEHFSNYSSLINLFEELIDCMAHDEFFDMGLENIANFDPESSFFYIRESIDEYGEFLNRLLLCDRNIKDKDTYKIYDPNSNGAYILHKTKRIFRMPSKNIR